MKLTLVYALLLILIALSLSCSVLHKNKNSSETTQNSELQKESESTQLKKENEEHKSHQVSLDTGSFSISFAPGPLFWKYDSITGTYISSNGISSNGITDAAYNKDNWVKINPDGSIEAKGNIKDVWGSGKKKTIKKDTASKQTVDSSNHKDKYKHITKTITVTKTKYVKSKSYMWILWLAIACVALYVIDFYTLGGVTRFILGSIKRLKGLIRKQ